MISPMYLSCAPETEELLEAKFKLQAATNVSKASTEGQRGSSKLMMQGRGIFQIGFINTRQVDFEDDMYTAVLLFCTITCLRPSVCCRWSGNPSRGVSVLIGLSPPVASICMPRFVEKLESKKWHRALRRVRSFAGARRQLWMIVRMLASYPVSRALVSSNGNILPLLWG